MERDRDAKPTAAAVGGGVAPLESEAPLESIGSAPFEAEAEATRRHLARVASLPALIDAARGSTGADQRQHASGITALLVDMRAPGHDEVEAREVLRALDARRFDGLLDAEGKSCRKEAVETLLAMGYPQALTVSPEDLDFARTFVAQPPATDDGEERTPYAKRWMAMGVLVVLAQLVQLAVAAVPQLSARLPAPADRVLFSERLEMVLAALAIAVAARYARRPPSMDEQSLPGTVFALLTIAQLAVAPFLGWWAVTGPAALAFAMLFLFGPQYTPLEDPPRPNDWDQRRFR